MELKRVELYNFSSYAGKSTFDFSTSKDKNIILIGGNNGAGKTSLFPREERMHQYHTSTQQLSIDMLRNAIATANVVPSDQVETLSKCLYNSISTTLCPETNPDQFCFIHDLSIEQKMQVSAILVQLHSFDPQKIIKTINSKKEASAQYEQVFKVGLANMRYRPTGGNKQLKYLFSVLTEHISWLEQGASGHPKPEKSNIINYDTITIEHISPQSPSGTSIFTGDDIHKLKNLTLLTPPENDLAANKDYAAKKPIYVNSTYKLNTFFESIDTWNVRASEQWETHLIDMACKIFVV